VNKFFKKLLYVLLLLLSPIASIAVLGAAYIAVRVISGLELSAAISSLITIINSVKPYFPYLTIIPAALFMLALFTKYKN